MSCKHFSDYNAPGAPEQFEADHFGNEVGRFFHTSQLQEVLGLIGAEHASILDVGTGTGRLAIPLAATGASVTGVDASQEMLKLAKSNAQSQDNPIFQQCDAHALPFNSTQFDYVISIRALMHFERWRDVLAELCRVSRHAVIVDVPPTFGAPVLEVAFDKMRRAVGGNVKAYRTFRLAQISDEFDKNGFAVTHVSKQFVLPFKLHRKLNVLRLSLAIEKLFRLIGLTKLLGSPMLIRAERRTA